MGVGLSAVLSWSFPSSSSANWEVLALGKSILLLLGSGVNIIWLSAVNTWGLLSRSVASGEILGSSECVGGGGHNWWVAVLAGPVSFSSSAGRVLGEALLSGLAVDSGLVVRSTIALGQGLGIAVLLVVHLSEFVELLVTVHAGSELDEVVVVMMSVRQLDCLTCCEQSRKNIRLGSHNN